MIKSNINSNGNIILPINEFVTDFVEKSSLIIGYLRLIFQS